MTDPTISDAIAEKLRHAHQGVLTDIRALVNVLIALPTPTDERVADIIGETRAIEVLLTEWRRGLVVEATAEGETVEGEGYRVTVGHKATRSYNTAGLLAAVNPDTHQALRSLRAAGAVELKWRWTQLRRFFASERLELRVVPREVGDDGDLDGPHVGEVWSDTATLQGKEGSS